MRDSAASGRKTDNAPGRPATRVLVPLREELRDLSGRGQRHAQARLDDGSPPAPRDGAQAIYLGASLYRIHGSNEPDEIGQAVSSGCIRLTNQDVIDLYNRVRIGATVIVQ